MSWRKTCDLVSSFHFQSPYVPHELVIDGRLKTHQADIWAFRQQPRSDLRRALRCQQKKEAVLAPFGCDALDRATDSQGEGFNRVFGGHEIMRLINDHEGWSAAVFCRGF